MFLLGLKTHMTQLDVRSRVGAVQELDPVSFLIVWRVPRSLRHALVTSKCSTCLAE